MPFNPKPSIGLMLTLLLLNSCKSEEIKQYRVAKVAEPPAVEMLAANLTAPFSFSVPKGWQQQASSGMRTASFSIAGGGDVSVVTLPGMAGDLKGNVNRWRGQVGLEPINDDAAVQKTVGSGTVDGSKAVMLELYSPAGKPDKAMRVALFERDGVNWFFKLAGPAQLVKAQKASFDSFTQSVKFKANAGFGAQAALPPGAGPDGAGSSGSMPGSTPGNASGNTPGAMPGANGADPHAGVDTSGGMPPMAGGGSDMSSQPITPQATDTKLSYDLPKNWAEKDPGAVRVASFDVTVAGSTGDVSIVNLAGDGGGLLSNTNRWRQQLELAPTDQAGLKNSVKDIQIDGNKGYFMALYTAMEGKGMLVALVEQGGQTWFIKMVGPAKLIQAQEADFQTFAKSIKFHTKGSQT